LAVNAVVTVSAFPTITLSGRPTVTVPLDLETSTSFAVPLTAITAPVALSARVTLPEETEKSPLSKEATPLLNRLRLLQKS
jgi:hypothetical protein